MAYFNITSNKDICIYRFSIKSEAYSSELLENLEDMSWYYIDSDFIQVQIYISVLPVD